ncbi:MAG: insulinase family protein [Bacteroidetes bacterium]|nr:MAG: insulinase family protein [Bacteroidota bacterium]REK05758.1 MAG: insulinase family protein [Bacteroidota bacterium]REK31935.1 MAG: insulinase family protein [Bacteroidota bacterium]REK50001.1 MAG: insulinase family protein [Bacteroidota bacterium]
MKSSYIKSIMILALVAFCDKALAQEIVELPLSKSNKVVIELMFRNGSICDPQGKEGLTALTASVVAQGGTGTMSASDIKDKIYPWAADYHGSSDKEVSIFTFEVPADFLQDFYPIVSGLILNPSFKEEDFSRVKSNHQNYVDQLIRQSSDEEYGKKFLEDMLFRGTNYQHMVSGTSEGVRSITLEDVKKHYSTFFTRNNLSIGIAGKYPEGFAQKMKADFQKLPAGTPPVPAPGKAKMPEGINVEIVAKENALGSAISAGFPLSITRSNDEFAALMVANSWLGEHRKSYSRLYQKIREARSMNYGDYTYIEWYDNGGSNMLPPYGTPRSSNYFSIWIRPVQTAKGLKDQYEELKHINIGHAHFALRMTLKEMDELIKNGMNQDEFEKTREFLRSYSKLYIQSLDKQLGFLMDSRFYGRKDWIKELDALLAKLTLNDVNTAIRKHWQTKNLNVVIITDKSEAEPLAQSLKNNSPSPMSYSNDLKSTLPAEILNEDKLVESYPMPVKQVNIIDSESTFRKSGMSDSKGVLKIQK